MRTKKSGQENASFKKVMWGGSIALFALMTLFLVVTLFSTHSLSEQIKLLTEHPFAVSSDVSDAKTNLALMRIRTERLQSYNQPTDIEIVRTALEELYVDMERLLGEIDALYLGPDEDTEKLMNTYAELKEAHRLFLDFAELETSTTYIIAEYEEEHLYQLYDIFVEDADRILLFVRGTQQDIFTSAGRMSRSAIVWSSLIMSATVFGLFLFQWIIRRMNHSIYDKNQQFEVISETIDEAFLIFGRDSNQCEYVSGNAAKVLGISSDMLYQDNTLIYQHISREEAEEIHQQVYAEAGTARDTIIEYHNPKNMHSSWLQLRLYPIGRRGAGKYIMTLTDRTEERCNNQALQDALESAQKANSAKKDFLSRMSHEIRTPMNAIVGMTTIAAASIDNPEKVESCLEKISYSSKHLLMLINDVLDMSRIESNRISINAEPFELYQFWNTFVSVVYPQANDKGLDFTEKMTGFEAHTTFLGDTLRLNQILLNLVSNAIKFTPAGGRISIEVMRLSARGNIVWLRFVVSDTGIGMNEEGLNHLYKPFEQADETIAGKYGGTGLGMSITQNLVMLMGGYITVKSKPGKGTTFTVELPLEQSDKELQQFQDETLENMDVLVVDDEKDICEHTVLLLERMKIHAEWVLSGQEAVERVVTAQKEGAGFDVCFIDWKMPEMDGVETARRIRKRVGPDTPIIIISAYDWSDIEEEARAAGVNAFIAKPMFQYSIYNALVSVKNRGFSGGTDEKENALAGKRFLVAEDNAMNMEIMVKLLEMNGACAESVNDGEQAVKRFLQKESGYYDAVLMDVQMPVLDGCEAARQIRASRHTDAERIPIIAITANAFEEDVAFVMEAGMNAHIGKPFDIKQLCTVLDRECSRAER